MGKGKYCYEYPRPALTTDVAVLRLEGVPEILLVERRDPPFAGMWALPGGFMEMDESLEASARRELMEECGIRAGEMIPFETYDEPARDPRGRTITKAFIMIWKEEMGNPVAASDASDVKWFDLTQLPPLAFDHEKIISDVIAMMREGTK